VTILRGWVVSPEESDTRIFKLSPFALDKGRKICYNMIAQGKGSFFNWIRSDKGKPTERWGRKATGLFQ
jgi:hypothetical protein